MPTISLCFWGPDDVFSARLFKNLHRLPYPFEVIGMDGKKGLPGSYAYRINSGCIFRDACCGETAGKAADRRIPVVAEECPDRPCSHERSQSWNVQNLDSRQPAQCPANFGAADALVRCSVGL